MHVGSGVRIQRFTRRSSSGVDPPPADDYDSAAAATEYIPDYGGEQAAEFVPSAFFAGVRAGYTFSPAGRRGSGYYRFAVAAGGIATIAVESNRPKPALRF